MISATLMECTSPAEPPETVKSWLARWTRRPLTEAAPVTTPSAGKSLSGHAEQRGAMFGEQSGLFETVRIDQRFHSFARRQLAALVLLLQPLLAAAQHGFAGALRGARQPSPALYEWPYEFLLRMLTSTGRDGYFVRLAVVLYVVGDGRASPAPCRSRRPRPLRAPERRRQAARRDPCPGSSDRCSARREELSAPPSGTWRRSAHLHPCRCSPASATAASRSSCHSGFSRSAGRPLIGLLPVCFVGLRDHVPGRAVQWSRRNSPASGRRIRRSCTL